jgi:hypothetical protein
MYVCGCVQMGTDVHHQCTPCVTSTPRTQTLPPAARCVPYAHGRGVLPRTCTGIGKSMLGYLLLYRWACEGRRVVLRKAGFRNGVPVLLCADGAVKLTEDACIKELEDEDVRCTSPNVRLGAVQLTIECASKSLRTLCCLLAALPQHHQCHLIITNCNSMAICPSTLPRQVPGGWPQRYGLPHA